MSAKKSVIWNKIKYLFTGIQAEVPRDQDDLGAYPLRMQISAIPERRYMRTARLFGIFTLINIAILIALAGVFVYNARRIDVEVYNPRKISLYMLDPEAKVIQPVEYKKRQITAIHLVQEQAVREFIAARYGFSLNKTEQNELWSRHGPVQRYLDVKAAKNFRESEVYSIRNEAESKKVNKEVHIYSLKKTPTGMWEALIDIFDIPRRDPFKPECVCTDNSPECISCKAEFGTGRHRFRVFARTAMRANPPTESNPFGIQITSIFRIPIVIHPEEKFWGVPAVLKPDL